MHFLRNALENASNVYRIRKQLFYIMKDYFLQDFSSHVDFVVAFANLCSKTAEISSTFSTNFSYSRPAFLASHGTRKKILRKVFFYTSVFAFKSTFASSSRP